MEKYDTTREATNDNTIQCMHFAYWLTKATDTHSEYVVVVVVVVVIVVLVVIVVVVVLIHSFIYCHSVDPYRITKSIWIWK
jgi:uncharacterized membrane protein YbhN (UPF0104 family)